MQTKDEYRYIQFEEYIKNKSPQTNKIKNKLLKEGIKEHVCEICQNTMWNGQPITLEVHHKDGNRQNNELANLQLLCPNCHSLTDNWRGRGKKAATKVAVVPEEDIVEALKESTSVRQALIKVGLSGAGANYNRARELCDKYNIVLNQAKTNFCKDCGREIGSSSDRCKSCENKLRKIDAANDYPVERSELKELIRTTSFVQIGKRFGVSENAIRKWCKNLNLPRRRHDIKQMSDEEWALV